MELEEVLSDIRSLKAECEMLLRITCAVDDLERDQEFAIDDRHGNHQAERLAYLH